MAVPAYFSSALRRFSARDRKILRRAGVNSLDSLLQIVANQSITPRLRTLCCWVVGELWRPKTPSPELPRRQVVAALLVAISAAHRELSMAASVALTLVGSKLAVPPLIKIMRRAPSHEAREAAAYALGFLSDFSAVAPLVRVLRNKREHPAVRGQAAEALGELHGAGRSRRPKPVTPLIASLTDEAAEVRFWSCYALANMRDPRAVAALVRLTRDRAVAPGLYSVGEEARWAIATLDGDPEADAILDAAMKRARKRRAARGRRS